MTIHSAATSSLALRYMQQNPSDFSALGGAAAPVDYRAISAEHRKMKSLYLGGTYGNRFGERFGYSVGGSYIIGLVTGCSYGLMTGIKKGGRTTKLRINAITNEVTSKGPGLANQTGAMTLLYVPLSKIWDNYVPEEYENFRPPIIGALTGALFKCTAKPIITGRYALAGAVAFSAIDFAFKQF